MIDTEHDLAGCRRSHARLLDHVSGLTDEAAAAPSLLPGWTVAMLVTHLVRNADSHRGMFEGAAAGVPTRQYPSAEARDADIELGRSRSADEVVADLRSSVAALEAAWDALPEERWSTHALTTDGLPNLVADLPFQRWREVEVHLVDLGLGFTHHEWDPEYVVTELDVSAGALDDRLSIGTGALLSAPDLRRTWRAGADRVTMQVEAPSPDLLAWLLGRRTDGFPEIGPWAYTRRR